MNLLERHLQRAYGPGRPGHDPERGPAVDAWTLALWNQLDPGFARRRSCFGGPQVRSLEEARILATASAVRLASLLGRQRARVFISRLVEVLSRAVARHGIAARGLSRDDARPSFSAAVVKCCPRRGPPAAMAARPVGAALLRQLNSPEQVAIGTAAASGAPLISP